jgi:hypothetical protein
MFAKVLHENASTHTFAFPHFFNTVILSDELFRTLAHEKTEENFDINPKSEDRFLGLDLHFRKMARNLHTGFEAYSRILTTKEADFMYPILTMHMVSAGRYLLENITREKREALLEEYQKFSAEVDDYERKFLLELSIEEIVSLLEEKLLQEKDTLLKKQIELKKELLLPTDALTLKGLLLEKEMLLGRGRLLKRLFSHDDSKFEDSFYEETSYYDHFLFGMNLTPLSGILDLSNKEAFPRIKALLGLQGVIFFKLEEHILNLGEAYLSGKMDKYPFSFGELINLIEESSLDDAFFKDILDIQGVEGTIPQRRIFDAIEFKKKKNLPYKVITILLVQAFSTQFVVEDSGTSINFTSTLNSLIRSGDKDKISRAYELFEYIDIVLRKECIYSVFRGAVHTIFETQEDKKLALKDILKLRMQALKFLSLFSENTERWRAYKAGIMVVEDEIIAKAIEYDPKYGKVYSMCLKTTHVV